MTSKPVVAIVMGSDSDLPTMQAAIAICEEFAVAYEVAIVSAHHPRTNGRICPTGSPAKSQGNHCRGWGAAHLPGMVAALTPLPVIGVPVPSRHLQGLDSLYSIVQMPAGIPVATVAIGNAQNAGLLAVQILATHQPELLKQVQHYRQTLSESVRQKQGRLDQLGYQQYLTEMQ